jgi:rhodanese-related sulfurtransferase
MSSSAISPRELAALAAARLPEEARGGSALILDLRSRRHQRRGRIPGSHSLPCGLLVSGEAPEGDLILVADSSAQATAAAEALRQAGYNRHLRHLDGGVKAWEAAGLPLIRPESSGRPLTEIVCGGLLMAVAAFTQSLGLLALGLVLLCGPWVQARARA